MKLTVNSIAIIGFLLAGLLQGCSQVTTYPGPAEEKASPDFTVKVDGKEVFVYTARVSAYPENRVWPGYQRPLKQTELSSFCYFDADKTVTVEIESKKKFEGLTVRPLSRNIRPAIDGNKITFTLTTPCQLVIEAPDRHHALHLFANAKEENPVRESDNNVIYFGPGIHHPGILEVKDNQTVYVAGGAVVHTLIKVQNAKNVTIKGRGILDASSFARGAGNNILIENCENIRIEGVILRDPPAWSLTMYDSQNITVDDIKLIGLWRYNADGIDIVNSNHVEVKNSFVRAFDDCIVLKGMKRQNTVPKNVHDVYVDNCVIWNDWGRAFEIGAETVADSIYRCTFRNSDIIHFAHIALGIQNGDRARIFDINYENIRIEDPITDQFFLGDPENPENVDPFLVETSGLGVLGHLIWVYLNKNPYSKDNIRGNVFNISYRDIKYTSAYMPQITFIGYDSDHAVSGITFDNVSINGKKIRNVTDGNMKFNDYAKNINFK